jgi:hypothetical protein
MKTLARACALICALNLSASLSAQVATGTSAAVTTDAATGLMADALKLRSDMATAITQGNQSVDVAIGQLRTSLSPSGLQIDPDADFAFAAIDLGQRLLANKRPAEAEQFFHEAETSLLLMVGKTPDSAAAEKVKYWQQLARIQIRYLNKVVEGKADLDAAVKLQPTDKNLQGIRSELLKDKAAFSPVGGN